MPEELFLSTLSSGPQAVVNLGRRPSGGSLTTPAGIPSLVARLVVYPDVLRVLAALPETEATPIQRSLSSVADAGHCLC